MAYMKQFLARSANLPAGLYILRASILFLFTRFFAETLVRNQAIRCFIFPSHLTIDSAFDCASCKTRKRKPHFSVDCCVICITAFDRFAGLHQLLVHLFNPGRQTRSSRSRILKAYLLHDRRGKLFSDKRQSPRQMRQQAC